MTYLIAHRGCPSLSPENSLEGFRTAVEHASVVELDVRVTSDGIPVCMHDPSLRRTHGVERRIARMTFAEVAEHAPDVPTLAAVLTELKDRAAWIIDCKETLPARVEAVLDVVTEQRMDTRTGTALRRGLVPPPGSVAFESADPVLLQSVKARTGIGSLELMRGHVSAASCAMAAPLVTTYAHGVVIPDRIARQWLVRTLRALNLGVYVYTVDRPGRIRQLERYRVSGVFTDRISSATG